jgi:hypothetical protein
VNPSDLTRRPRLRRTRTRRKNRLYPKYHHRAGAHCRFLSRPSICTRCGRSRQPPCHRCSTAPQAHRTRTQMGRSDPKALLSEKQLSPNPETGNGREVGGRGDPQMPEREGPLHTRQNQLSYCFPRSSRRWAMTRRRSAVLRPGKPMWSSSRTQDSAFEQSRSSIPRTAAGRNP